MELTEPGDVVVDADELYRFYRAGEDEVRALRGVSLTVHRSEVVVVAGPSGSGKSTLLTCLAGLDDPSGGTVRISGRRISHQPESYRARLRATSIGMLFQSGNLVAHLSVVANVRLAQRLAPRDRRGVQDRTPAGDIVESLGLGRRADALPAELSGGEAARAGLAVALANRPMVLLADEPTGELDGATERLVLDALRSRADDGVAVVVASHSTAARGFADRVVELDDGRIAS
ncbi:MAG TPA: ABC transporter ATP-binding protein [Nocardioidaceae bacterium]|nr:ABC transporter ATP-binding protein [Nocardioidaceae bacterium]